MGEMTLLATHSYSCPRLLGSITCSRPWFGGQRELGSRDFAPSFSVDGRRYSVSISTSLWVCVDVFGTPNLSGTVSCLLPSKLENAEATVMQDSRRYGPSADGFRTETVGSVLLNLTVAVSGNLEAKGVRLQSA